MPNQTTSNQLRQPGMAGLEAGYAPSGPRAHMCNTAPPGLGTARTHRRRRQRTQKVLALIAARRPQVDPCAAAAPVTPAPRELQAPESPTLDNKLPLRQKSQSCVRPADKEELDSQKAKVDDDSDDEWCSSKPSEESSQQQEETFCMLDVAYDIVTAATTTPTVAEVSELLEEVLAKNLQEWCELGVFRFEKRGRDVFIHTLADGDKISEYWAEQWQQMQQQRLQTWAEEEQQSSQEQPDPSSEESMAAA